VKRSIDLRCPSPDGWLNAVMNDFDSFLNDHADCERKASAMALSMIAKYPDRHEMIPELIETAQEELEHFRQVYELMQSRGLRLKKSMAEDLYVKEMLTHLHSGMELRFLDRLLLGSILECRGAERFRLIYEALEPGSLKSFYHELWASEAKHGNLYVNLALLYFEEKLVYERLNRLADIEGKLIVTLPFRPALH
jgi:tRNA 2-(methylsulfanyl)-N6-isopentenyladenosine37 hydroxylase